VLGRTRRGLCACHLTSGCSLDRWHSAC